MCTKLPGVTSPRTVTLISFVSCGVFMCSLHRKHEMNSQCAVFVCLSACLISRTSELTSLKFGVREIYTQKLCIAVLSVMTLFFVTFEVVIAVMMKCPVFLDVTSCRLARRYKFFGGAFSRFRDICLSWRSLLAPSLR